MAAPLDPRLALRAPGDDNKKQIHATMPRRPLHADGMKHPCVYILASHRNGTLYVGVTSNLAGRIWQHRHDLVADFTQHHGVHTLVWFEPHASMAVAIAREKSIKRWRRQWKLRLIESTNPAWRDLYPDILDSAGDAAVTTRSPPPLSPGAGSSRG